MKDKSYFYTEALPEQKAPRTRRAQRNLKKARSRELEVRGYELQVSGY